MLLNIDINNIAVIENISFSPDVGMTVLTGETGAGKSVIIDSVNLVLGARTNKTLVRYGTKKAKVSAMFSVSDELRRILSQNSIEAEDELIIAREITDDGKSISRINGDMVTGSLLREISHLLVNIHGQHDNQALLNPSKHIDFLDKYAEGGGILSQYKEEYRKLKGYEKELEGLMSNEQDRLSKIDLLKYQTDELSKAQLRTGEEEELKSEFTIMSNSQKITKSVADAFGYLYENEMNSYDLINKAISELSQITAFDERLSEIYERLSDASYAIEDASHELRSYMDEIEYNPERLDELSQRLDLIKKLERKYGVTVADCIEFYESAKRELDALTNSDEKCEELLEDIKKTKATLSKIAKQLSDIRQKAAKKLSEEIEKNIFELDMEKAVFSVSVKNVEEFLPNGCDVVEFMFSANPGQPPKGLSQIASGGELSRVMLAMKTVLSTADEVETLIFDEIDTGVSGSAAKKIAKKLAILGENKQVICISHQPQLAAASDYNFRIEKTVENDVTRTVIKKLDSNEKINEVAKIIDGAEITDTSIEHAKEMILKARD